MDIFDEARSLEVMIKRRNLSQTEVAKMLGVSQSYVANKLRLLGLDEPLRVRIVAANLSERHARALLRLAPEQRPFALDTMIDRRLSVAEADALVDFLRIGEMAAKIGRGDRLSGVDLFIRETKKSLSALSSIGVTASQKISYHGSKIFMTICIENG